MSSQGSQAPARRHLDLGADYLLRSAGLLSSVFEGDIMRGLVFLSALRLATREDAAPRSITLSALARSLRLPIETTRRHVLKLDRDGFLARTANGGVLVTPPDRPDLREALAANSANLRDLATALGDEPRDRL